MSQHYLTTSELSKLIKPFVIGRKNWMFSNTANGAKGSATLYSLVETAKANGLVPFDYINYLLNEIPSLKPDDTVDHLLPWNCAKR